ncbi:MAG: YfdX family protein, partial [Chromatiaceae bacterium]|nr:YfdX family protein [Chromatiaceae bacterium]
DAIEALKLAEIDVAVTASMIPVKFAKEHIDQAAKLVGERKYYEANLALKAVDDEVVVQTFAIDAVPKVKAKEKKGD